MYRMTSASHAGRGTVFNGSDARAGDPVIADIDDGLTQIAWGRFRLGTHFPNRASARRDFPRLAGQRRAPSRRLSYPHSLPVIQTAH